MIDDRKFLWHAFERMAFIRAFEGRALELTRGENPTIAGSIHLCAGQEAVPVGAMAVLRPEDRVLATYRGHGWALESGLSAEAVFGEICQRGIGVNGGRAGSALITGLGGQFVGENSIVGAGVPLGCGVAAALKSKETGGIALVSIGDGAMNQGAVSEAMSFAAARRLPLLIVCENNGWAEMTRASSINRSDRLARRATAFGIQAATVDGTDPLRVRESVALAAEALRAGDGPAFLEFQVPRLWGHYNRDIEHYRPKADRRAAEECDPLTLLGAKLLSSEEAAAERLRAIDDAVRARMEQIEAQVLASPPATAETNRRHVVAPVRRVMAGAANNDGKTINAGKTMTYQAAVNSALDWALRTDPNVVVYGEDVGKAGGIFGASRGLQAKYGEARVFDTPIAESAILGSAVGAAMQGMRPIVEIMWADFLFVALDQLVNQAANVRFLTGGAVSAPLVVRTQQGMTPGSCAQHSQCVEALLAHVPGLKVALAATPQDAYDLLLAAIDDPDPCVVIEARALYFDQAEVIEHGNPEPAGSARLRRGGQDAVIVTWGAYTKLALEAAERHAETGRDIAVLDLRWVAPLDEQALFAAVEAAGRRVLILHEDTRSVGFGAELSARLHEHFGPRAGLHVVRLATEDVRIPSAPHLQRAIRPDLEQIDEALVSLLQSIMAADKSAHIDARSGRQPA